MKWLEALVKAPVIGDIIAIIALAYFFVKFFVD